MRKARIQGPYSAALRAEAQVHAAQNLTEHADAIYNLTRAMERLNRLQGPPPTTLQRLGQVAATTRFNMGGVSPLVGRTLAAAGIGKDAIGAFSLVATGASVAAAALEKLATATVEGGRAMRELQNTATISGGTPEQAARMRAFGLTPAEAAALRQRLATDPYAMSAGAMIGVRALPQPFGSQNNAELILKVVEGLRGVKDPEERLRRARMMGAEDLLPLADMSEKAAASLMRTADGLAAVQKAMGPSAGADFEAAGKRWELAIERLKGSIFKAVGPGMTDITNKAVDVVEGRGGFDIGRIHRENVQKWKAFQQNPSWDTFSTWLTNGFGPSGGAKPAGSPHTKAVEANTEAIERQTALMQGRTFGGGYRGAGAIPAMLNGQAMQNAAASRTVPWSPW